MRGLCVQGSVCVFACLCTYVSVCASVCVRSLCVLWGALSVCVAHACLCVWGSPCVCRRTSMRGWVCTQVCASVCARTQIPARSLPKLSSGPGSGLSLRLQELVRPSRCTRRQVPPLPHFTDDYVEAQGAKTLSWASASFSLHKKKYPTLANPQTGDVRL